MTGETLVAKERKASQHGSDLVSSGLAPDPSGGLNLFRLIKNSTVHREKRKHRRFMLDLPLDYRPADASGVVGGIVINAGEGGFLIRSLQEMAVGSRVNITVLFPNKFQLATFDAVAQIVRKERRELGQIGVKYGLRIVRMSEINRLKLRYVLAYSPSIQG